MSMVPVVLQLLLFLVIKKNKKNIGTVLLAMLSILITFEKMVL